MKGWLEKDILRFLPGSRGQRIIKWMFTLERKDRLHLEVLIFLENPKKADKDNKEGEQSN